jgi:hypothetical protein
MGTIDDATGAQPQQRASASPEGNLGLLCGIVVVVVVSVVGEAGIGKSRYAIRGRLCKRQGAVGGARAVIR